MRATLRIDTRGGGAFDRMIFGQFLEHFHREVYGGVFEPGSELSDENGFRADAIEALRELKVPIVRWPGGCFVSAYHWKDGVGPVASRPAVFDKAWRVEDPNTFGTDEFVAWCRAIGAEPYLCTNAGTGSEEEMSDWVEYCNGTLGKWAKLRADSGHPEPYNVKYWSIGNENYGGWEVGAKTSEQWSCFVAESAKMMLRADSDIRLLAAALPDRNWTLPLLQRAGGYLSQVSIHAYWDTLHQENTPSSYAQCMMRSEAPEQTIRDTEAIIEEADLPRKVGIAFDEWNLRGWHHPNLAHAAVGDIAARDKNDINSTYTMADAVFSACFLNACLRRAESVKMACLSPVINARGPLFVHPGGIVKRTTFHVMKMYSDLRVGSVLATSIDSDPFAHGDASVRALDAVATVGDGGKKVLVLVNRHETERLNCSVLIDGRAVQGDVSATVLAGDSPDAFNDIDVPARVVPEAATLHFDNGSVHLPPHSITLCTVPPAAWRPVPDSP